MARVNLKMELDRQELERLYLDEALSASEIANRIGCSETSVLRVLKIYGIPRRSKRDYRLEISRAELERLYLSNELSESEIAEQLHTSQLTISRRLREFGIPTRPVGSIPYYAVPKRVYAAWSPNLAYAVGLIVTDGSLDKDRVRVEFLSTDKELIELYSSALHIEDIHLVVTKLPLRRAWYKVKLSDSAFRMFLEGIGLTPNKSKTLGVLKIPDDVFVDFTRGVFDGDGSWYLTSSWKRRYEYLHFELVSASSTFIDWMALKIKEHTNLNGLRRSRSHDQYHYLTFNGRQAIALGEWLYGTPAALSLARRREIWERARNKADSRRSE